MSFIGRAAAWTHPFGAGGGHWSNRRPAPSGVHLTPLNVMTGSRIAAGRDGVVRWVGGPSWDEVADAQPDGPRSTDHPRRPYQHLFEVLTRQTNRAPQPLPKQCPRCGQAPHNDWGHAYERLVCKEITIA
jgi:hypothetical protein